MSKTGRLGKHLILCDCLSVSESPWGTSLLGGGTRFAFPPSNARRKKLRLAASLSRAGQEPRATTKGAYPLGFPDARLPAASLVEPGVPSVPPVRSRRGPPPTFPETPSSSPLFPQGGREGKYILKKFGGVSGGPKGRCRHLFEITYLDATPAIVSILS